MSNMNRAFFMKKEARVPKWIVIDAEGKILGRLATQIADILRGKHIPQYTPHTDGGDYVVVINAEKVALSREKKWDTKIYDRYSGWIGGYKTETAREKLAKKPTEIIELAVQRMLPKTKMGKAVAKKLKLYVGDRTSTSSANKHSKEPSRIRVPGNSYNGYNKKARL